MLDLQRPGDIRIEGFDGRTRSDGGLHDAAGARTCTTRATGRAASASAGRTASEAAYTAAGSALHQTAGNAAGRSSGLGAQDIGVSDLQVVAGDCEIEIVLKRERDRVAERQRDLAVGEDRVGARGIRDRCFLRCLPGIRREQVREMRAGLGVIGLRLLGERLQRTEGDHRSPTHGPCAYQHRFSATGYERTA
jgi:hypothetical protein